MDSVIYENGKKVYRARFNKKGLLEYEWDENGIVSNRKGSPKM